MVFRVIFVSIFMWISLLHCWLLNFVLFKKKLVLYFIRVRYVCFFFFTFLGSSCLFKTYSYVIKVLYDSYCFIITGFPIVNYWSLWFVYCYLYKTLARDIWFLKKIFLLRSYYLQFIFFNFYAIYYIIHTKFFFSKLV